MTLFLTVALLIAAASAAAWWMARARSLPDVETAPPVGRQPPTAGTRAARTTAVAAPAANPGDLAALEWDAPRAGMRATGITLDTQSARIRDRYIAARFPGVLRGSDDLREIEHVIKVARHYFEEGHLENAAELFALALEQAPAEPTLRLAQLEIAYLARDAGLFTRLARELRATIPVLPEWDEVVRLGHAIAPGEALFESGDPADATGHYGPWPDMPNWIQASWDLTGEVQAADFHRAMASRAAASHPPALRLVA